MAYTLLQLPRFATDNLAQQSPASAAADARQRIEVGLESGSEGIQDWVACIIAFLPVLSEPALNRQDWPVLRRCT